MSQLLLLHMDVVEWAREQPDDSIDHIITDYEYGTVFPFVELTRICRGSVITFCAAGELPFDRHEVQRAYWIKTPSTKNNKASRKLSRFVEEIHIYRQEYDVFNGDLHWSNYTGVYTDMVETQGWYWKKPLSLMERLVRIFTSPGDVVADPYCGSGTTIQACLNFGRDVVGVDHDEKWVKYCKENLAT